MINGIENFTYDSWSQFKESVYRDLRYENNVLGKYIYRGQPNSKYVLTSTFDRFFPDVLQNEKKTLSNRLLSCFKDECDYNLLDVSAMDEMSLMAYARHHGLPTRLLDWSRSIYVAAFFAYSTLLDNNYDREDVSIYALNIASPIVSEESGLSVFTPQAGTNKRQFYQQGLFTCLNTYHNSIDDYVTDATIRYHYNEPTLYKLTLPASEQKEALIDLQFMNINYTTLFGDADGYSKNALLKFRLSGLIVKS